MSADPLSSSTSPFLVWGALGLVGVGAVVAAVIYLPDLRLDPEPATALRDGEIAAQETGDPPASMDAETQAATDPPQVSGNEPEFGVVRMEPDGTTLVAGTADPRARVSLVIDGVTRAETESDAAGQFVVFVSLEASVDARVMWLVAQDREGEVLASRDTVMLAPGGGLRAAPGLVGQGPDIVKPADAADPTSTRARLAAQPGTPPGSLKAASTPAGPDIGLPGDVPSTAQRVDVAGAQTTADPAQGTGEAPPLASFNAVQTSTTPALAPPTRALLSDAGGVRVLQTAPLSGTGEVRLDSLDYGADGAVVLRGRAAPGGTVSALLDGNVQAKVAPDADGSWTLSLTDVVPGDYALSVARRNESGTVSDEVALPFRREPPGVVAAALAGAPAKVVTVQPGATLWAIARDRYGDGTRYVQVYDANRGDILNPDLIYPGQVFELPGTVRP